jgi:hypothetical protein
MKRRGKLAPLHFEPLFWEERFDWARGLKYLIPLVFRKSEVGKT